LKENEQKEKGIRQRGRMEAEDEMEKERATILRHKLHPLTRPYVAID